MIGCWSTIIEMNSRRAPITSAAPDQPRPLSSASQPPLQPQAMTTPCIISWLMRFATTLLAVAAPGATVAATQPAASGQDHGSPAPMMMAGFEAYRLRCDGSNLRASTPSAAFSIDNPHPRFAWAASHPVRGERQTAYRVVVKQVIGSSTRNDDDDDDQEFAPQTTVWDSGRVLSAEPSHRFGAAAAASTGNVTAGAAGHLSPLRSDTYYSWSVTLWDSSGRASAPAAPARFHVALLHQEDWKGVGWVAGNAKMNHNMLRATFGVADPATVSRPFPSWNRPIY
jgi:hypothetical protein